MGNPDIARRIPTCAHIYNIAESCNPVTNDVHSALNDIHRTVSFLDPHSVPPNSLILPLSLVVLNNRSNPTRKE